MGVQKVRIEKVETNVDLKKGIFSVYLFLKFQHNKSLLIAFHEGDTIFSLYQLLKLYFGSDNTVDINRLYGKDLLVLKGEKSTDIAFSAPRSGKWVVFGNYDKIYTELEAKQLLES